MPNIEDSEVERLAKSNFEKDTGRSWERLTFHSRQSDTPAPPALDDEKEAYRRKAAAELSQNDNNHRPTSP